MYKFGIAIAAILSAGVAQAAVITEIESNDTLATAQGLDGNFTLDFSGNIGDSSSNTSTTIPHVTVQGFAESGGRDTFKFTVTQAGSVGIFDIDFGMPNFDGNLTLFNEAGSQLAYNDDFNSGAGQGGSFHPYDSFIQYTFNQVGTFMVQVGTCCANSPFYSNSSYELQVSLQNPNNDVPEPAAIALLGLGVMGIAARRRRRA